MFSSPTSLRGLLVAALALACAQLGLAAETGKAITPTGHIELFNGKDFTGWAFFARNNADPLKTWSVADGLIKCAGKPTGVTGYLYTEQDYRDYRVTVEWRFTQAGNTGVLAHITGANKVWPLCFECQGMHNDQGDFWLQGGATCKERVSPENRRIVKRGESAEKPVGEWNTFVVVCRGDTIQIYVNDRLMNEATGCNVSSGKIGIQSEGAGLEIRKIVLDPLPAL